MVMKDFGIILNGGKNKMKIAFVGDSFCMNCGPVPNTKLGDYDWPWLVVKEDNAEILITGVGGQHFYNSFIKFLPKFKEADYIIMCVSEPFRIINNHNLPMNFMWVKQMLSKTGNHWKNRERVAEEINMPVSEIIKIAEVADGYYKYLFDTPSQEFLQVGLVSFIDDLLLQHKKKVIWFPCFDQSLQLPIQYWHTLDINYANGIIPQYYVPKSGPYMRRSLNDISFWELKHQNLSDNDIHWAMSNDSRRNHFNERNNRNMARLIIDRIRKDNFEPGEIIMENYFVNSKGEE